MNEIAALLIEFGFTATDAPKIARRAHQNALTLADVQAWIDEAYRSRSIHNPRGFVRARIRSGDKIVSWPAADCHHTNRRTSAHDRQRYANWLPGPRTPITHTCACGRVVYASHICPDCGTCPTCCTCDLANQHKE